MPAAAVAMPPGLAGERLSPPTRGGQERLPVDLPRYTRSWRPSRAVRACVVLYEVWKIVVAAMDATPASFTRRCRSRQRRAGRGRAPSLGGVNWLQTRRLFRVPPACAAQARDG